MPRYFYTAKTLSGAPKTGFLEAENEHELAKILRQEGYVLISANKEGKGGRRKILFSLPFLGRVSLVEKIMFTRNLQVMVGAGISLPRALTILSEQVKSAKFKKILLTVSDEISKGNGFSESLAKFPDIFPEVFSSMVRVGEEGGTLEDVLDVLIRQMEREYEVKSKIKGAMAYPAVIITAMMGIGFMMMVMVVPKLAETFKELQIELPLTTRMVVATAGFLAKFWYLVPIGILFMIILFRMFLRTTAGKLIFGSLFLKIPIISSLVKKTNSAYTVRTLSSLIASGVPIVKALEVTAGTLKNIYYKRTIIEASEQMKKGTKISDFLKNYQKLYPILVIQMMAVGEETGQMVNMLQKLADFYEEEVTRTTKNLSSIVEPVLMLVIGAVVGFFVISMVQPMYSMIEGFQ